MSMMGRRVGFVLALALALYACGSDAGRAPAPPPSTESPPEPPDQTKIGCEPDHCAPDRPPPPVVPPSVHVRFLGVAGFFVEREGEAFMSAPLFTRPSIFDVTAGSID